MDTNKINENINYLVHQIHQKDMVKLFEKVDDLLASDMEKENAVRTIANVFRIFLLKESSYDFIKLLVDKINTDYEELLEYDSMNISLDILNLMVSNITKAEAVNNLLERSKNAADYKDKMHAMCYLGSLILSSGNYDANEAYFTELEKLKGDEEYIVDNLNFDKVTTRFNYDHYETLIKVTEIRLQKALLEEDESKINSLMEEIIATTKKLKETNAVDDYERVTMYSVAKMALNSGYIDLEEYFMNLYNNIDDLKGYVLESYFDYLNVNYPSRLDSNFKEIAKKYWKNSYQNDDEGSKKAFLFVMIDYISSYGQSGFDLEEILNEVDKLEDYKY